jgi:pimeloyl-[acyl-carrier protein] synthase
MDAMNTPLDLTYAGTLGDRLFPPLNELRETDPVHWDAKANCWIVTRHADIADALGGRVPVSNVRLAGASISVIPQEQWAERLPNLVRYSPHHITNMDPPRHTRMRSLLTKAFGKPVVEALRPHVKANVADLMARMRATAEIEFGDIALDLPGHLILKMLELDEIVYPRLRVWANDVMVGLGTAQPEPEWIVAVDRAFAELTEHVLVEIKQRRESPHRADDLISALVYAKDGKDALTDEEIVGVLQVVVIAGHDTTANSMTLGVRALAQHPEAWKFMRENPDRILESVTELMRYTSMSAAQNRTVAADFTWHGKELKKGETVFLMFAAGNRDPRVFENPEALDLTRANNDQSLTFAPGIHHCIGHLLAKMQLTEFFSALVASFDGATVVDEEVAFANILVFRAIPSMRMRFQARKI